MIEPEPEWARRMRADLLTPKELKAPHLPRRELRKAPAEPAA